MKSKNLLLILLMMAIGNIYGQTEDTLRISLEDALQQAKEKNLEIKLAKTDLAKMKADKNKSLATFLPQVTLSETFIKTNDPLNTFGFKLKQEIVSPMDFNPALLNDPDEIDNYTSKIEIMQPIINFDGFFGRAAASKAVDAMRFKVKRTKEFIDFSVRANYFQLVLAKRSLNVVDKALKAAKAGRNTAKDYYDKGYINKADYLMAEVYVSGMESKKLEALNAFETAGNNLKFLLDLKSDKTLEPMDNLVKKEINEFDYNLEKVNDHRSDMMARKYRVDALKHKTTMNYMKFLPRLNAFGSFEYNDKDPFGTNAESWMVGVNLQWKVFNGFKNIGEIQKTKAELDRAETELHKAELKNRVDIEAAIGDLNTAKKKLILAENALKQSDESLRILRDRYEKGMEKTADYLRAEAENAKAHLNYLKTLFFYNISVNKVELLLGEKISI